VADLVVVHEMALVAPAQLDKDLQVAMLLVEQMPQVVVVAQVAQEHLAVQ
jgi:hypothetical protein